MDAGWGNESRVMRAAAMPLRHNANGSESRDFGHGALPTGEHVRVHATMQPPGTPASPLHRIAHTEFLCIMEGEVEFQHDGKVDRATAGDILFIANGTLHTVRNVGSGPARYTVVSIGGDVA